MIMRNLRRALDIRRLDSHNPHEHYDRTDSQDERDGCYTGGQTQGDPTAARKAFAAGD